MPGIKQTSFRCDSDLLKRFQKRLLDEDASMSMVIEGWIRSWMKAAVGERLSTSPPVDISKAPQKTAQGDIVSEQDGKRLLGHVNQLRGLAETLRHEIESIIVKPRSEGVVEGDTGDPETGVAATGTDNPRVRKPAKGKVK